jgi:hypothetical protein
MRGFTAWVVGFGIAFIVFGTGPATGIVGAHIVDRIKKGRAMLKWFLRRQIAAFERAWNDDASYIREIMDANPWAMIAFGKVQGLSRYRTAIPLAAYCAAGLIAVMAEDCDPCTQLGIDMAEREGVDPAILRAIVARDYIAVPFGVALAARFTEASLSHAPEVDDLRDEVLCRWGRRGLISLTFAILSARMACRRRVIDGETRPALRNLTAANTTKTVAA